MKNKISIVTSLYKSRVFLEEFLERILASLSVINCLDFELIFVNDGSPDDSIDYLIKKQVEISQIKIIDLARNFGHHYALQSGLKYSSGDYVFIIDNDLETPPEILVDFYTRIKSDASIDVVYGYQEYRKGASFERISGDIFWKIFNKLSPVSVPKNILTERLMTRKYIDSLLLMNDSNLFLGGMFYWVGYNQIGVPVKKGMRESKSTYTFSRKINLMIYAITSFSSKPLEWMFKFGIFVSAFSTLFLIILGMNKLIYGNDIQIGWTSIVALILFVLGILSTFVGLLGVYMSKIYNQVQGRPNVIIKKIFE
jgi:putative glycosyltransferase